MGLYSHDEWWPYEAPKPKKTAAVKNKKSVKKRRARIRAKPKRR